MNFIQGLKKQGGIIILLAIFLLPTTMSQAQPSIPAGQVDIFMGVDFNYRNLSPQRDFAYRHGSATERHAAGDHADGFCCPEPFCLRQTVWRRFGVGHYV